MHIFNTHTRRQVPFYWVMAGIAITIWFALRIVLWLQVGASQIPVLQTLKAFAVGAWFDVNALCFLLVQFLLLSLVMPNRWRVKPWANKARWVLAFLVTFGLLFGAVSEFIFWQEFTTRFNFIAVD